MDVFQYVFQDWGCNAKNLKGQFVLINYRFAQVVKGNKILLVLFFWHLIFYTVFIEWVMCIELNWNVKAGKNLQLHHGFGLVIHRGCVIGNDCVLRHGITIGNKGNAITNLPIIGNNVNIGANTTILGGITIGNNVVIGAGSVVVKSVPTNCIVVGNPAKIIKHI